MLNYGKADVNKLETLLLQEQQKEGLKQVLSLERIFSIAILDATVRGKFAHIEKESKAIFSALLGVYYFVFTYLCEEVDSLPTLFQSQK